MAAARAGAPRRPGATRRSSTSPSSRSLSLTGWQHDARGRLLRRRLQELGRRRARGQPPAPGNSGMPSWETVYGLTVQRPRGGLRDGGQRRLRLARPGVELDAASDGIPGSASPITTWAYPQKPADPLHVDRLQRHLPLAQRRPDLVADQRRASAPCARAASRSSPATQGAHLYAATEDGLWEALQRELAHAPAAAVAPGDAGRPASSQARANVIMWSLTAPVIPGAGALGPDRRTQSNGGYFLALRAAGLQPAPNHQPEQHHVRLPAAVRHRRRPRARRSSALNGTWTGHRSHRLRVSVAALHGRRTTARPSPTPRSRPTSCPTRAPTYRYRVEDHRDEPGADVRPREPLQSAVTAPTAAESGQPPRRDIQIFPPDITVLSPGENQTAPEGRRHDVRRRRPANPPDRRSTASSTRRPPAGRSSWLRCNSSGTRLQRDQRRDAAQLHPPARGRHARAEGARHRARTPSGTTPAPLDRLLRRRAPRRRRSLAPIPPRTGGPPTSQAPCARRRGLCRRDARRLRRRLAGPDDGLPPALGPLRRRRRRRARTSRRWRAPIRRTGPTYTIRAGDVGSTLRMRVDRRRQQRPHARRARQLPAACRRDRHAADRGRHDPPGPAGGGPPAAARPRGGGGGADTIGAGDLGAAGLSRRTIVAGKRAVLHVHHVGGQAPARVVIAQSDQGPPACSDAASPRTRKNRRKRKACTFFKAVRTITKPGVAPGQVTLAFKASKAKRKLRPAATAPRSPCSTRPATPRARCALRSDSCDAEARRRRAERAPAATTRSRPSRLAA